MNSRSVNVCYCCCYSPSESILLNILCASASALPELWLASTSESISVTSGVLSGLLNCPLKYVHIIFIATRYILRSDRSTPQLTPHFLRRDNCVMYSSSAFHAVVSLPLICKINRKKILHTFRIEHLYRIDFQKIKKSLKKIGDSIIVKRWITTRACIRYIIYSYTSCPRFSFARYSSTSRHFDYNRNVIQCEERHQNGSSCNNVSAIDSNADSTVC